MDVRILNRTPIESRFDLFRNTPLENTPDGKELFPFRNADLRMVTIFPGALDLSARYYVHGKLDFQRSLRAALLERYDVDTLRLSEALQIEVDGVVGALDIVPPVVELYTEEASFAGRPGCHKPPASLIPKRMWLLHDGVHRGLLALEEGLPLRCVLLDGADHSEYLPYVYPNVWEDVVGYDAVPPAEKKKFFRFAGENPYLCMPPLRVLWTTGESGSPTQYGRV